ncbi:MAG TPA: DUF930 domain-containing protein [Pseudolabrys sp.]|nr:DUF930 domain-containing protein [Pseudolabrys sp.]
MMIVRTKCALAALFFAGALSSSSGAQHLPILQRVDPNTRQEQICDIALMDRIGRDRREYSPDRAKSDALAHPHHGRGSLRAEGAAFRSGGRWYKVAFVCRTTADNLKVISLTYKIGGRIPQEKLADYDLWE